MRIANCVARELFNPYSNIHVWLGDAEESCLPLIKMLLYIIICPQNPEYTADDTIYMSNSHRFILPVMVVFSILFD